MNILVVKKWNAACKIVVIALHRRLDHYIVFHGEVFILKPPAIREV